MRTDDQEHPVDEPHVMPRWVKVCIAIAVALVVLLILLRIFGGGNHGPGRHMRSGAMGDPTVPARAHG